MINKKISNNEDSIKTAQVVDRIDKLSHQTNLNEYDNVLQNNEEDLNTLVNVLSEKVINQKNELKEIYEIANIGIWDWKFATNKINVSNHFCKIFDRYDQFSIELTFQEFISIIHPDDQKKVEKAIQDAIKNDRPYNITHRYISKYNRLKYIQQRGKIIKLDGKPLKLVGSVQDITEQELNRLKIVDNENKFKSYINNLITGIIVMQDYKIVDLNEAICTMFGYKYDDLIGSGFIDLIHPDDFTKITKHFRLWLRNKTSPKSHIIKIPNVKGEERYAKITCGGDTEFNKKQAVFFSVEDVSNEKLYEVKLENTLKEKEVLLAEVNHRVKNNLQIISGLLNMQIKKIEDNNVVLELLETQSRIKSISLVHEKLYQSNNFSSINLKTYLNTLIMEVINAFKSKTVIEYIIDIEKIDIKINQAIPLGLIINEILSNIYKHAFPDKNKGEVKINLKNVKNVVFLTIRDNGVGFDTNRKMIKKSIGHRLIKALSNQIDIDLNVESGIDEGVSYTLKIPINTN